MTGSRVAAVVLAAGSSSRMEAGFKLLLPWGGGVVVDGAVRAVLAAGLAPVVVVTGHRGDEVRRALEGAAAREERGSDADDRGDEGDDPGPAAPDSRGLHVVHNPRHAEGLATSLARGVREVRTATDAAAAAVLMGDEPGIRPAAIRRAVQAWRERAAAGEVAPVVRARYRDRPGHPVIFPRDVFGGLEALEGDRGALAWMERHRGRVEEVRLETAAPTDVDTDADYRALSDR